MKAAHTQDINIYDDNISVAITKDERHRYLQLGSRNIYWMNEVNMCHGSKCMNDEKKYKPYVAASEMTISRKAWFVATRLVGNNKPSHQYT
jgi:hypothetical protein